MQATVILVSLTVAAATIALVFKWLKRQTNRIGEFFLAAMTTSIVYGDEAAEHAAALVVIAAASRDRERLLRVLTIVVEAPIAVAPLFLDAASEAAEFRGNSIDDAAKLIRNRASRLLTRILVSGYRVN